MAARCCIAPIVCLALVMALGRDANAQVTNYVVGPQDVLAIAVYNQPNLGGKYTVEADGTFTFPLVGRIEAGGLTLRQVEEELRRQLKEGYFRNPQLSVAVEQYHSQRLFVVGEVRNPGAYAITGDMTLIEALARAGALTEHASGEALIVRSDRARETNGPVLPNQDESAQVIRVDVKELQGGKLIANAALRANDTIFIPRAELVYVFGQVKNPTAYPLQKGTTVLQALSLAGGVTDRGAINRIRIVRIIAGKRHELRVALEELVQPGDTIIVPERFF